MSSNAQIRTISLVAVSAIAVAVAIALFLSETAPFTPKAVAQERAKPSEQAVRSLVEAGPERKCESDVFTMSMWGRRTTYSDKRVEYSVRVSIGNAVSILTEEQAIDFISFAKSVDKSTKDLQVQKPAEEAVIIWQTKDSTGDLFQLTWSPDNGVWMFGGQKPANIVQTLDRVVKDIEGIKANKARVPW